MAKRDTAGAACVDEIAVDEKRAAPSGEAEDERVRGSWSGGVDACLYVSDWNALLQSSRFTYDVVGDV